MAVLNTIRAVALASFASSSLSGSFQALTALPNACFMIRIYNGSSTDITISYDGSTSNEYIKAGDSVLLMGQTNAQPTTNIANFPAGFTVWVKGTAGTGNVYLSGYYQPQGASR